MNKKLLIILFLIVALSSFVSAIDFQEIAGGIVPQQTLELNVTNIGGFEEYLNITTKKINETRWKVNYDYGSSILAEMDACKDQKCHDDLKELYFPTISKEDYDTSKDNKNTYPITSLTANIAASKEKINLTETGFFYVDIENYDYKDITKSSGKRIKIGYESIYLTVIASSAKTSVSFALDSNGRAHVAYGGGTDPDIAVCNNTDASGAWSCKVLYSDDNPIAGVSMAIDSADVVHIGLYNYSEAVGAIIYYNNSNSEWTRRTIVARPANAGKYSAMAINTNDEVFISYRHDGGAGLSIINNSGAGDTWGINRIDAGISAGQWSSLAFDSNNKFHASHLTASNWLAYCNDTGADISCYDFDSDLQVQGYFSSIAIDSNNKPHIVSRNNSKLMYCNATGPEWSCNTIDDTANGGFSADLVLDENNNPHIIHFVSGAANMRYCNISSGTWDCKTISDIEISSLSYQTRYLGLKQGRLVDSTSYSTSLQGVAINDSSNKLYYFNFTVDSGGAPSTQSLSDKLVSAYNFELGSGSIAIDSNGTNNLYLNNTPTWDSTHNIIGSYSLGLSAASDEHGVNFSAINLPQGNANKSFSLWFNRTAGNMYLLLLDDGTDNILRKFGIAYITTEWKLIGWGPSGDWDTGLTNHFVDNESHHLVITYNGTEALNTTKLYIDGVLTNTTTEYSFDSNLSRIWLGRKNTLSDEFNGQLDSVYIFNDTITPDEVGTLYYDGIGLPNFPEGEPHIGPKTNTITLNSPLDASELNEDTNITFNFTAVVQDLTLENAYLWGNFSGDWSFKQLSQLNAPTFGLNNSGASLITPNIRCILGSDDVSLMYDGDFDTYYNCTLISAYYVSNQYINFTNLNNYGGVIKTKYNTTFANSPTFYCKNNSQWELMDSVVHTGPTQTSNITILPNCTFSDTLEIKINYDMGAAWGNESFAFFDITAIFDNTTVINNTLTSFTSIQLQPGDYIWNVKVFDNETFNWSESNFTLTINDTTVPTFTETPTDYTYYNNTDWAMQINATDNYLFDSYTVNNTDFITNTTGGLTNNTYLSAGTYSLNISINDTTRNSVHTYFNVTVLSNNAPSINTYNTTPLTFNTTILVANATINVTDDDYISSCNFFVAHNGNVLINNLNGTRDGDIWTSKNFNTTTMGYYTINVTCSDNNTHSSNTFANWSRKSTAPPKVILSKPLDISLYAPSQNVTLNATVLVGSSDGIANCSLWLNSTGTWKVNQTNSSGIINNSAVSFNAINFTTEGHFLWNVICEDNGTVLRTDWGTTNRTLIIDINNAPNVSANLLNHTNDIISIPSIGKSFWINATSTDSDGDDVVSAKLTMTAPNGTKIFNNLDGSEVPQNKWTWPSYYILTTVPSGKWEWNITVTDNSSAVGRTSGDFSLNNSQTYDIGLNTSPTTVRFNNTMKIFFTGRTYDYNLSSVNLSLTFPNGTKVLSNTLLTNTSEGVWNSSEIKLSLPGTYIMKAEFRPYSGNPTSYSESFTVTDELHSLPLSWNDSATADNNQTFNQTFLIWADTNASETLTFNLTSTTNRSWFNYFNLSVYKANLNDSTNQTAGLKVITTIKGNGSFPDGLYNYSFTINRTSKGDNNVTIIPIQIAINPPAGNIELYQYENGSILCNSSACVLTSAISTGGSTSKIWNVSNSGKFPLEGCTMSTVGDDLSSASIIYTNLDTSTEITTFDLANESNFLLQMNIAGPDVGSYFSNLNIVCTSSNFLGDSDELVASNQPLINLIVSTSTVEVGGGGGGGGSAPPSADISEIVEEIITEVREELAQVPIDIDLFFAALAGNKDAIERIKDSKIAVVVFGFLMFSLLLFLTTKEKKVKK